MDLLDRLLGHDAWTTRQLIERCSELSDEQLDRQFDIGHRSIRATLQHIIFNMEAWSALMARVEVPRSTAPNHEQSMPHFSKRLDRAADRLAEVAKAVSARSAWDERWLDVLDQPPVEKTYGGAIAHVITHSMHHRAQLLYMLRQLGVSDLPEGDVLSWEHQRESA
ncbi:MAG: DinB family protein [Vicinamibacterales bacterium]